VLERAELIERWMVGGVHFCRLIGAPLDHAVLWIDQQRAFWERQLDAVENYLTRGEERCRKHPN
jgi:hypothetical protein